MWQLSDPNFHLFYLKYLIVCHWQYEIAFVTTAKLIFGSVDEQAKGGTYGKVTLGKFFGIEHFSQIFAGLVVGTYIFVYKKILEYFPFEKNYIHIAKVRL